jgi:hypothetical protein
MHPSLSSQQSSAHVSEVRMLSPRP